MGRKKKIPPTGSYNDDDLEADDEFDNNNNSYESFTNNTTTDYNTPTPDPWEEAYRVKREELAREHTRKRMMDDVLNYQLKMWLDGGPSKFRVIAQFGDSSYDITVTKQEELQMVRELLFRFSQRLEANENPTNTSRRWTSKSNNLF